MQELEPLDLVLRWGLRDVVESAIVEGEVAECVGDVVYQFVGVNNMVFPGELTEQELAQLKHDQASELWRHNAKYCRGQKDVVHTYIPVSWQVTPKARHVKTLMCTDCFHEINISDAYHHRIKI